MPTIVAVGVPNGERNESGPHLGGRGNQFKEYSSAAR
jgi:hypothetical protein